MHLLHLYVRTVKLLFGLASVCFLVRQNNGRISVVLLLLLSNIRGLYQKSLSIKETIQEYQDSQEDMGVTGFLTVDVDLKNITATPEDEDDLKKSLILIPKEKDKKASVCVYYTVLCVCVCVQCTCTLSLSFTFRSPKLTNKRSHTSCCGNTSRN